MFTEAVWRANPDWPPEWLNDEGRPRRWIRSRLFWTALGELIAASLNGRELKRRVSVGPERQPMKFTAEAWDAFRTEADLDPATTSAFSEFVRALVTGDEAAVQRTSEALPVDRDVPVGLALVSLELSTSDDEALNGPFRFADPLASRPGRALTADRSPNEVDSLLDALFDLACDDPTRVSARRAAHYAYWKTVVRAVAPRPKPARDAAALPVDFLAVGLASLGESNPDPPDRSTGWPTPREPTPREPTPREPAPREPTPRPTHERRPEPEADAEPAPGSDAEQAHQDALFRRLAHVLLSPVAEISGDPIRELERSAEESEGAAKSLALAMRTLLQEGDVTLFGEVGERVDPGRGDADIQILGPPAPEGTRRVSRLLTRGVRVGSETVVKAVGSPAARRRGNKRRRRKGRSKGPNGDGR